MSVWDDVDPWNRVQVREKREEVWAGSYATNRAKALAEARTSGYPGMWKCSGCSRTLADEWAWFCHISAEKKATMVSKKRPWSLLCLGPSVEKTREWEQQQGQERQQQQQQEREQRKKEEKKDSSGGIRKGKCPNCEYAVTWHATHCCASCMKDPHAGNHGPLCDGQEMSTGAGGKGPHPPYYPPVEKKARGRGGKGAGGNESRRDSRERHQVGADYPTRGTGRRDPRARDPYNRGDQGMSGGGPSMGLLPPDYANRERGRSRSRSRRQRGFEAWKSTEKASRGAGREHWQK
jgi:hypothetical protein